MSKKMNIQLVGIDPQNDFMGDAAGNPYREILAGGGSYEATLPVKGALDDMKRAAAMIDRIGHKLSGINVTLDSHKTLHIAHADLWQDQNARPPAPFTMITADDVRAGIWTFRLPQCRQRVLSYLDTLEASGKFVHIIWPTHCRIGTWGHNVERQLEAAITRWERKQLGVVNYVTKGSAIFTEHFGALAAQVPDPNDPSTQLNAGFIRLLQNADLIGIFGEASSHCVKTTVEQVVENIGDDHLKKIYLITDAMSPVGANPGTPDFPAIADQFLLDMQARGLNLVTSTQFLA